MSLDFTHGWENLNYPEDQRKYMFLMKKVLIGVIILVFIIVCIVGYLSPTIEGQPVKTTAETLPEAKSLIGLILENSVTALYWSLMCSYTLINTRIYDPVKSFANLSKYPLIQKYSLFLRYTIEQLILWFVIQLVLLTYLNSELSFQYTPVLSVLYFLGRFIFYYNDIQK